MIARFTFVDFYRLSNRSKSKISTAGVKKASLDPLKQAKVRRHLICLKLVPVKRYQPVSHGQLLTAAATVRNRSRK